MRRLTPSDWETWRAIRLRALAEDPAAFGSTLERESVWSEAEWRARIAEVAPFVVEEEGRPMATAGLATDPDGMPHVVAMWVAPEARRRRLATALLEAAVQACRAAGHTAVRLHVAEDNGPARALYLRHGFVDTGRAFPLERDRRVIEREMELRLL